MTRRKLFLPALGLALAVSLAACSGAPAASPSPASSPDAPLAASPAPEAETSVLQGTLNTLDAELDFLIVVDGDGNYCRFNLGDTDAGELEPGDAVMVTYTGQLSDDEEITATVTAIEKVS